MCSSVLDHEPALRDINRLEIRNAGFEASLAVEKLDVGRRYDRSQQFLERAERVIPLGAQTFSKSKIQLPPGAAPLMVTHGDGGRVYDVDGNEYVDLINALLPNILGYRDPHVDQAIRRQLSAGISFSLPTILETELAERLVKHIPCAEMVRFGKNGTDATSAAISSCACGYSPRPHYGPRVSWVAGLVYRRDITQPRRSCRCFSAHAYDALW